METFKTKQDMCENTPFWKENLHEFSKTEEMRLTQYHTSVASMDALLRTKSCQCEAEKDDVCQTIRFPFLLEGNEQWQGSIESILYSPYMDNFRMLCEESIFFGEREVRYSNTEYSYKSGVFYDILGKQKYNFPYERDVYSSINDWIARMRSESHEEIFYVWAGGNVLSWLSRHNDDGIMIENIGNLRFVKIETLWGTLMIRGHYLLDTMGMENKVLIYDPAAIELRVRIPMRIRRIPSSEYCRVTTFLIEESFTPKIVNKEAIRIVEMKTS